jgi:superfamily II DNA or RNA helicase
MATVIIGNTKCKIMGLDDPEVIRALDLELSYHVQGFQFMRIKNNWDGRYRLFDKRHFFPVGLLGKTEKILKRYGVRYNIEDNRYNLNYGTPMTVDPDSGFQSRDYQLEMVDKAWKAGSGIVRAATGAGKSFVISMLTARFNVKTVVYVIGIELLYQMKATLERAYPGLKVGMVGDGHCDVQKVTVATIWSAATAFNQKVKVIDSDNTNDSASKNKNLNKEAVKKMVRDAEMIIIDECQYAASATVQFLHRESTSAKHRFLFSGTPWRENGDDILIEAVGGPKIYDVSASRLIDDGWLIPPKIYFLNVPRKMGVGKTYPEVYQNYIVKNNTRNDLILKAAKKMVNDGRKTLILVTKIEHGKALLELLEKDLRVSSLDGSNRTRDRLAAIAAMKKGDLDILIASKIFDQGIDIPELDGLILAGSGKSRARALQRIGRVIRTNGPDKTNAIVVDFNDQCKYLREHSRIRKNTYATEPRFKIIEQKK